MATKITRDALESYLNCKTKTHLKLAGHQGSMSDYQGLLVASREEVRRQATVKILAQYPEAEVARNVFLTTAALAAGPSFVLDATLEDNSLSLRYDGLKRVPGHSLLGAFHYAPVLYHEAQKVGPVQRLLLAALGRAIGDFQGRQPSTAFVYRGRDCHRVRVEISAKLQERASVVWRDLRELPTGGSRPRLMLNAHCSVCEFHQRCRREATDSDDLSLLQGLGEKDVRRFARKGILTVTQLAHTFRPRRRRKRSRDGGQGHNPALQALAIRDRKTYVFGSPQLPDAPVRVYLDLEGKPDERFVYLVGVIIADGSAEARNSFWADGPSDEPRIFDQLLRLLQPHDDFRIFTYGSYEMAWLKRMRERAKRKGHADRVLARTSNVLTVIYRHVYFPVYSNGLKDVARHLGFAWTEPDASGLQSLVWRAAWEQTGEAVLKQKLLQYNQDDCSALRRVTEALLALAAGQGPGTASTVGPPDGSPVARVEDLDTLAFPRRSGSIDFANPDFAAINKCAYFDYQRKRVYVRTNRALRRNMARAKGRVNRKLRVSKEVFVEARSCPYCRSKEIAIAPAGSPPPRPLGKRAFDLVITPSGIRRRVIRCRTSA
jgi:predicted RecB family nuclease